MLLVRMSKSSVIVFKSSKGSCKALRNCTVGDFIFSRLKRH